MCTHAHMHAFVYVCVCMCVCVCAEKVLHAQVGVQCVIVHVCACVARRGFWAEVTFILGEKYGRSKVCVFNQRLDIEGGSM